MTEKPVTASSRGPPRAASRRELRFLGRTPPESGPGVCARPSLDRHIRLRHVAYPGRIPQNQKQLGIQGRLHPTPIRARCSDAGLAGASVNDKMTGNIHELMRGCRVPWPAWRARPAWPASGQPVGAIITIWRVVARVKCTCVYKQFPHHIETHVVNGDRLSRPFWARPMEDLIWSPTA